jgi:hypothetical protein
VNAMRSKFGGDVSIALDEKRLGKQLARVKEVLVKAAAIKAWVTLRELSVLTNFGEASISARIRDLRKDHFGGYTVQRRRRGDPTKGIWEYLLVNPERPVQEKLF